MTRSEPVQTRARRPTETIPSTADIGTARVAIAHDYLTQRGGAERVVMDIVGAFPGAPLFTALYSPSGTFPEFSDIQPNTSALNRVPSLRRHHRLALPVLAPAVSLMRIDADVTVASSSGWAHGIRTTGRKIVYCHAPARWLYQRSAYLGGTSSSAGLGSRLRNMTAAKALAALSGPLRQWDRRAASSADVYLANSTVTRQAIADAYGLDAEVVPPPPALLPAGTEEPLRDVDPGFFLCVARLLPYKNVDAVIRAVHAVPQARLIVVGAGPEEARLLALIDELDGGRSTPRIRLAGRTNDQQLRWLYRNCVALVAASIEDYGLTPLEAAAFGKPTVALAAGGYLDTMIDGTTGVMFASLDREQMASALVDCVTHDWKPQILVDHAETFGPGRFRNRLREVVSETLRS